MQQALQQEPTVADLLRVAVDETRELARAEIGLAKQELSETAKRGLTAAVAAAAATLLIVIGLTLLVVGLLLSAGGTLAQALCVGGVLFALAAVGAAFAGLRAMPKSPFERTRGRLEGDVRAIKDRIR